MVLFQNSTLTNASSQNIGTQTKTRLSAGIVLPLENRSSSSSVLKFQPEKEDGLGIDKYFLQDEESSRAAWFFRSAQHRNGE